MMHFPDDNCRVPSVLILLRHGESSWNHLNFFCGWIDVAISTQGQLEAARSGQLMAAARLAPDIVHTSLLRRTITTANIALDYCARPWIPVQRSWRLNERHYGALQGQEKRAVRKQFGDELFYSWRRSYDVTPPPIDSEAAAAQARDPRYAGVNLPRAESLQSAGERMKPYWSGTISPQLRAGRTVLVVTHGSMIRSIVKSLDKISDADIPQLNIPTGIPLVYHLAEDLEPTEPGRYLDPEAARIGMATVAAQGQ